MFLAILGALAPVSATTPIPLNAEVTYVDSAGVNQTIKLHFDGINLDAGGGKIVGGLDFKWNRNAGHPGLVTVTIDGVWQILLSNLPKPPDLKINQKGIVTFNSTPVTTGTWKRI